ncbi:nucleoside triphosphate pyrophosphohydrolase family protein [Neobacillus sp. WH10]|uniref:nucleoside triphosphate pyrophosphohydrolase family protein n=1 Tax=Neobacillus sp. WH10 TaxID=3047873 RepID=UPI0024C1E0EC|nr:nucleoside triphosphate pyrophosphohydrolase family protein [Neobacillus sp. WH10]WHY76084.1 nucleoside triphosphate pyrophosphohydrolase family protein [Neobacillus sp. WH10]
MRLNEYMEERKRTESKEQSIPEKLTNYAMGCAGETGEIVDIVKKIVFQGHPLEGERTKLIKEFGDDFWYRFGLMELFGITLEEVLETNIYKLNNRYPDGFDKERSVNRNE